MPHRPGHLANPLRPLRDPYRDAAPGPGGGRRGRTPSYQETGIAASGPPVLGPSVRSIPGHEPLTTQPGGPYDPRSILLGYYNKLWTDDEFRDMWGIADNADVSDLRDIDVLIARMGDAQWERLEAYDVEVRKGIRRPQAMWRLGHEPVPTSVGEYARRAGRAIQRFAGVESNLAERGPGGLISGETTLDIDLDKSRISLGPNLGSLPDSIYGGIEKQIQATAAFTAFTVGETVKLLGGANDLYEMVVQAMIEMSKDESDSRTAYGRVRAWINQSFGDDKDARNTAHRLLADYQTSGFIERIKNDPFLAVGIGSSLLKGGVRATTGLVKGLLAPGSTALETFERVPVITLRSSEDILTRAPKSFVKRATDLPGIRNIREFIDASADLNRLGRETDKFSLKTVSLVKGGLEADKHARLSIISQHLRSLGDDVKEFGVRVIDDMPTGRAHNVPGEPDIGELLERAILNPSPGQEILPGNPAVTFLTRKQKDMIQGLRQYYKDFLQLQLDEGIPVKELHQWEDLVYYVARKLVTPEGGKAWGLTTSRGMTAAAHMKSRGRDAETGIVKLMTENIKNGARYRGPFETARFYAEETYTTIINRRLLDVLSPFSRDLTISETLRSAALLAERMTTRQGKALKDVANMLDGYRPIGSEWRRMRRAFPQLIDDIDELVSTKPKSVTKILSEITTQLGDTLPASREAFRREMRRVLDVARLPSNLKFADVRQAVRNMGIASREQARVTRDIQTALTKVQQLKDTNKIYDVIDKMAQIADVSIEQRRRLAPIVSKAKETARGLIGDESMVPVRGFSHLRFGTELVDGRVKAVTDPRKYAEKLTAILADESPIPRFFTDAADAIRTMKTGYDMGTPWLQGLPVMFTDARAWGLSVGLSLRAFADDGVRATYVAQNSKVIVEAVQSTMHLGSTEFFQTLERGGWLAKLALVGTESLHTVSKITSPIRAVPIITTRFQSSFETFLDVARIEIYKALRPLASDSKDPRALITLAEFVNKLTGVIDTRALGVGATQRAIESSLLMFSPRYMRATLALLTDMTRGGLRGELARKAVVGLMVGQYALHMAVATMLGQEPNLTPGEPDHLAVEIPLPGGRGVKVKFGGKFNSLNNMLLDLTEQMVTNPGGILDMKFWSAATYDNNLLLKRIRYGLPTFVGTGLDIIVGADPIGKRLVDPDDNPLMAWPRYLGTRWGPFFVDAAIEAGGVAGDLFTTAQVKVGAAVLEFGGLSTFPIQEREKLAELYDEETQKLEGTTYAEARQQHDFGRVQRDLDKIPAVIEQQALADSEARQYARSDLKFSIQERQDTNTNNFVARLWGLNGRIDRQEVGPHEIRDKYRELAQELRVRNDQIIEDVGVDDPDFAQDRKEFFLRLADDNPAVAARNDYYAALIEGRLLSADGSLLPSVMRRHKRAIAATYGDDAVQGIEDDALARLTSLDLPPHIAEWVESWEILRPYWDAYLGVVPEDQQEVFELWKSFSPTQQETQRDSPRFSKMPDYEADVRIRRLEMQRDDYEIDAMLYKFYGRRPLNPEHIEFIDDYLSRER